MKILHSSCLSSDFRSGTLEEMVRICVRHLHCCTGPHHFSWSTRSSVQVEWRKDWVFNHMCVLLGFVFLMKSALQEKDRLEVVRSNSFGTKTAWKCHFHQPNENKNLNVTQKLRDYWTQIFFLFCMFTVAYLWPEISIPWLKLPYTTVRFNLNLGIFPAIRFRVCIQYIDMHIGTEWKTGYALLSDIGVLNSVALILIENARWHS